MTTFDLSEFLNEVYRVTSGTVIVFCGKGQVSKIYNFFQNKQDKHKGTVRQLIWEKCLCSSTVIYAKSKNDNLVRRMSLNDLYRLNYKDWFIYNGEDYIPIYNMIKNDDVDMYYEITLRNGNTIKCTNNHKFFINGNEIRADELSVGNILDSARLECGDVYSNMTFLTDEAKWFIGHFIAEGSYSYDLKGNPKTIQIATNKNNTKVINVIKKLCSQYGASYCVYDKANSNSQNIKIHSKILLSILSEYVSGKRAYGKHFDLKCFNIDVSSLDILLQGYLDGDGYFESKNNRYTIGFTRQNYELAKDLNTMCNILGYKIFMHPGHSTFNGKKYATWVGAIKKQITTHWSNKSAYEIVGIRIRNNNNKFSFYDLQLKDNSHRFCLYDGTLTHNCNPSPMNGQHIYLSGIENAVWFKKRGGVFNAHCKNTVFRYPCGRSKLHPTEKNHGLLKELILDNSNPGDIIFDPCCGSGAHCLVAKENGRNYIGCEINKDYFEIAQNRLLDVS